MEKPLTEIQFFATPREFRKWLSAHHRDTPDLWVGFYKKSSGHPSITWPEAVDEALCVGWIDGLRKTVDHLSYKIRFTPRRKGSNWSAVNIRRAQQLSELGRMRAAGLKAFNQRNEEKCAIYS